MPSFASACRSCTAWAATCADEWRRIARPASEVARTTSTVAPSGTSWARSKVSPSICMATTDWSSPKRSSPVVVPGSSRTSEESSRTTVMVDTVFLPLCGPLVEPLPDASAAPDILLHPRRRVRAHCRRAPLYASGPAELCGLRVALRVVHPVEDRHVGVGDLEVDLGVRLDVVGGGRLGQRYGALLEQAAGLLYTS